jgi:MFS family permease
MLGLLRQRNMALLWVGGLISLVGDWVLLTALPYYVYQLTNSLLATAAMTVIQLAPAVILSSVAGAFVDRWDRKATLVICNLLQSCIVLLLLLVHSTMWLWTVYVVVCVQATVSIFVAPAEHALLPRLVTQDDLTTANSLFGLSNQLARLLGPPLGGALLAWFGIDPVVVLDSGSFLIVAVMLVCLAQASFSPLYRNTTTATRSVSTLKRGWADFWREWVQGWKLIREKPLLMRLMLVLGIMTFGGTMIDPLFPAFVKDIMRAGPLAFGWILTVQAIGGIMGGLVVGHLGGRVPTIRLLAWGNALVGGLLLIQYNVPVLPVALLIALLLGPEQVATGVALQTLMQTSVENSYQGRLFGAMSTTGALLSMLGGASAGPLGERIGIVPALNVTALLTLLAAGIAFVALPGTEHPTTRTKRAEQGTPPPK